MSLHKKMPKSETGLVDIITKYRLDRLSRSITALADLIKKTTKGVSRSFQ